MYLASGFAEGRSGARPLEMTMRARRAPGGGWLLNGRKRPCTLTYSMDFLTCGVSVEAEDGGRQRAVGLVPADSPGIERRPFWKSHVLAGAESDEVILDDVHVPDDFVFVVEGSRRPRPRRGHRLHLAPAGPLVDLPRHRERPGGAAPGVGQGDPRGARRGAWPRWRPRRPPSTASPTPSTAGEDRERAAGPRPGRSGSPSRRPSSPSPCGAPSSSAAWRSSAAPTWPISCAPPGPWPSTPPAASPRAAPSTNTPAAAPRRLLTRDPAEIARSPTSAGAGTGCAPPGHDTDPSIEES